MNFEMQTVRCPIEKITKHDGLYKMHIDFCLAVRTPLASTGYEFPTIDGFKKVESLTKGDIILLSLPQVVRQEPQRHEISRQEIKENPGTANNSIMVPCKAHSYMSKSNINCACTGSLCKVQCLIAQHGVQ